MDAKLPNTVPGLTVDRHILESERNVPGATGELTGLLQQIALAAKIISSKVRRAGLANILGLTGKVNVQGEEVQKLDQLANDTLVSCIEAGGYVCVMGSEEIDEPIAIPGNYQLGKYVLLFDPLDGSGNIDVNATIGTIFSIYRRRTADGPGTLADCLQPGKDIVASGYVIYGSSCILVYTAGKGVHGFTLDPSVGEFFLSHENIRIPARGDVYSVNEGYYNRWDPKLRSWADWVKKERGYSLRYSGAFVADVHRTLLRGGIFAYPGDSKNPKGKLRLLYEAAPMGFIVEQAGGAASTGERRILEVEPEKLHQRTPVFMGSKDDVADVIRMTAGENALQKAM